MPAPARHGTTRRLRAPVHNGLSPAATETAKDAKIPAAAAERASRCGTPEGQPDQDHGVVLAELPASLTSARKARTAVRRALAAWGINDPSGDAELIVSELVANAAEHGCGPISLTLSRDGQPDGRPGLTCEVADTSPAAPRPRHARPSQERGRGLAIVAALAADSGVRAGPAGKTAWFTLALRDRTGQAAPQAQPQPEAELELEAGA
jgi:anti-sigma regulatory factor (Ser/Thr protein kinase)